MTSKETNIVIAQEDRAEKIRTLLAKDIPSTILSLQEKYPAGIELDEKVVALEATVENLQQQLENIHTYQGPTEVD